MGSSIIADLILLDGEIVTMDSNKNIVEAIAIKDEKIIATGKTSQVLDYKGENTETINLHGRTVVPGFIDSHQHFFITGLHSLYMSCDVDSIKQLVHQVEKEASSSPKDKWIIGYDYNESKFEEGRDLTRRDFKHIEQPVFMMRYDQHSVCVNDKALEIMKIDKETVIDGGVIEKDESGELTGLLRESAFTYAKEFVQLSFEELTTAATFANDHNIEHGVTSLHEAGLGFYSGSFDEYRVLEKMDQEDKLKVRVYGMVLDKFFDEAKKDGLVTGVKTNKLKVGSFKIFADGTWSAMTAGISEEYPNQPGNKGVIYPNLREKILKAHKEGYQLAIHAMGDRTIEKVLEHYEEALKLYPREDSRHRIEHASTTNDGIIKKMKQLGVVSTPITQLLYNVGDYYLENFPLNLLERAYEAKTLIDEGLKPAANSDSPVSTVSPLFGMFTLMSRTTRNGVQLSPHQKVSLYEALEMYTINGAHASFDEDERGSLEIGKLGDLVVLPEGFLHYDETAVKNTKVQMTIIGGEVLYENADA